MNAVMAQTHWLEVPDTSKTFLWVCISQCSRGQLIRYTGKPHSFDAKECFGCGSQKLQFLESLLQCPLQSSSEDVEREGLHFKVKFLLYCFSWLQKLLLRIFYVYWRWVNLELNFSFEWTDPLNLAWTGSCWDIYFSFFLRIIAS